MSMIYSGLNLSVTEAARINQLEKNKEEGLKLTPKCRLVWFQDRFLPPDQRTNYHCDREPTGAVDRKQLIDHINKIALETPDQPESVPYVPGVVRGKKVHAIHILFWSDFFISIPLLSITHH